MFRVIIILLQYCSTAQLHHVQGLYYFIAVLHNFVMSRVYIMFTVFGNLNRAIILNYANHSKTSVSSFVVLVRVRVPSFLCGILVSCDHICKSSRH